jgi:predicted kinase
VTAAGRLILVCGLPGSGKTTVARELEASLDGIRFCPDEWMERLGIDLFDQATRGRIESLQWDLAQRFLRDGDVVVIEWGVWQRSERDELLRVGHALGAAVELRYLDVPLDVLWERVQLRQARDPDGALLTYDHLVGYSATFEPPDADELARYDPPLA